MKETVGLTTMFKIVLAFTFLFAAFLTVAITYNKVYKLKNETISIIEKYEGVNSTSLKIINNYLKNNGYDTMKNCETDEYGVVDLGTNVYEKAQNNKKYYYCLKHYCSPTTNCPTNAKKIEEDDTEIFYKVRLFFKFNLPFFGDMVTFKITGDTKAIKYYDVNQRLS